MNRYVVGSTPVLRARFTDADGQPADPTTITLTVVDPAGVTTTYTNAQLVHDATGAWSKTLVVATIGVWSYTWDGDGSVNADAAGQFRVAAAPVLSAPGPCQPWAEPSDVCGTTTVDEALLLLWLAVASSNLFQLTGRQWPGECSDTWFPTAADCAPLAARGQPARRGDSRLLLPGYPVVSVEQVLIDGVAEPADRYRIEDQRYLVHLDADGKRIPWRAVPDWSITYTYGQLPIPGGRESAASLGYQYALACSDTAAECRLPKRVQSITRQGVTMAVLDPLTLLDKGKTGVEEVDAWLAAVTVGAARRPSALFVPGSARRGHRRTG